MSKMIFILKGAAFVFKKGKSPILYLMLAIVLLLTACGGGGGTGGKNESGNENKGTETVNFKPGTYSATHYGYLSYITVETTFSEDQITEVKVIEQEESPEMFVHVEEQIPQAIVEHQSLAVDTVTGATFSSRAILNAVSDCVEQAGGDPSVLLARTVETKPGRRGI